jgi:hypothetical protein
VSGARDPYRVGLEKHSLHMFDTVPDAAAMGGTHIPLPAIDAMPHARWIEMAMRRLQAEWPAADRRRLRDIADELFADPRSGLLEPEQAVHGWLQMLSGHA